MIEPSRSRFERITQPSLPWRLAVALVLLVAFLVIVGMTYSDPGCIGEGIVP